MKKQTNTSLDPIIKIFRRDFIKLASLTSLSLLATPISRVTAVAGQKPNILFIAIDDCKPMLGCYGNKQMISPNIDRIASQGRVFLNNHCQWAVCGPSRASLITSTMPETNGVIGFKQMRAKIKDIITIPEYLIKHSYTTAATGKINDPRCVEGGRKNDDPQSWSIPYVVSGTDNPFKRKDKRSCDGPDLPEERFVDGQICNAGIKLLHKVAEKKQPFFLGIGFKKPHLPFYAPKKYWGLYDRDKIKIHPFQEHSRGGIEFEFHNGAELRQHSDIPDKGVIPEEKQKEVIHGYYACVSFIDSLVGRIMKELTSLGLEKNTIICLWGDHGFHLGDHGMWAKHSNLEQATRSPLIISGPGVLHPGKSTSSPTAFIDIFPTLCEMVGVSVPKQVQGRSLLPILKDPSKKVQNGVISIFRRKGGFGYAYRTDRYRFIEWINGKEKKLAGRTLYDYKTDPMEKVNLAKEKEYKAIVEEHARMLRKEARGCDLLNKVP